MNNNMNYESCLWDNYDNGICGVVYANHYSVEHVMTRQEKPEPKFDRRPAEESKEFGKKF